jgi:uncharacterized iron-regulated membrane protein
MRKLFSTILILLAALIALGGLVLPGLVLAVLGVWLWPRKKKVQPAQENNEPIWSATDRKTLYHEGDLETSSDSE